jgi:DNA repair protein RadC
MGTRLETRLIPETPSTWRNRTRIYGPEDAWRATRSIHTADREHFLVLHMDSQNRLVAQETVSVGTLGSVATTAREVFKGALLNNSAAIILVHNHPSGDPTPSPEDWAMSRKLVECGQLLGVPVLDHVVVGPEAWRSCIPGDTIPITQANRTTTRPLAVNEGK